MYIILALIIIIIIIIIITIYDLIRYPLVRVKNLILILWHFIKQHKYVGNKSPTV